MTIKSATTNDYRIIASINLLDTFGGQNLQINFTPEIIELVTWWQEWKPVFVSKDPSVMDALKQAKVLHEISK
jgi:hypothetical protein